MATTRYLRSAPAAWSGSSVSYDEKDFVEHSGTNYRCLQDHVSSAGTEPGTGGGAAYWAVALVYTTLALWESSFGTPTDDEIGVCPEPGYDIGHATIGFANTNDKTVTLTVEDGVRYYQTAGWPIVQDIIGACAGYIHHTGDLVILRGNGVRLYFEWLQFTPASSGVRCMRQGSTSLSKMLSIKNCIFEGSTDPTCADSINFNTANYQNIEIAGNIFYKSGDDGIQILTNAPGTLRISNNVAYKCGEYGINILIAPGTWEAKNNIAIDCTTANWNVITAARTSGMAYNVGGGTFVNGGAVTGWTNTNVYAVRDIVADVSGNAYVCYTGHTSAAADKPGAGANWRDYWVDMTRITAASLFKDVTDTDEDLHLLDSNYNVVVGADQSAYLTYDMDGETWSNWHIGADQPVAPTPPTGNILPYVMALNASWRA